MRPAAGRQRADIRDAVLEPFWSGVRVIAHVGAAEAQGAAHEPARSVRFIEELGADVAPELPAVALALARSVDAVEAVIDSVITRQVALRGIGAAPIVEVQASQARLLMRNAADVDVVMRGADRRVERGPEEGIVAVDLLQLDGTVLLDVPLLERKRLLESVVRESELVRVSIHTRPPLETWVATWKALGLRGGILKAANSRYQPGQRSAEWRIVETVSGPRR